VLRLSLAIVVALLLAGCGDAPERDADAIPEDAGAALDRARTYRFEERLEHAGIRCEGRVDHERTRVHYRCTIGAGELELIWVGSDEYARGSFLGLEDWDKSSTDTSATEGFPDPRELLAALRRGAISTETLGAEDVRGVEAIRYRIVADVRGTGLYRGNDPKRMTIELWIDNDDLIRRLRLPNDGGTWEDFDMFAFGEPVDIEPPPADEIDDSAAPDDEELAGEGEATAPCAGGETDPLDGDDVRDAFATAEIELEDEPTGCADGARVALAEPGGADPESAVTCVLYRDGDGTDVRETALTDGSVELELANVECRLFVVGGATPPPRIEAVRQALAALRASLD
jgi:hypothetical protein